MGFKLLAILAISVSLVACSRLPSGAPTASDFEHPDKSSDKLDYLLLDIDQNVAKTLAEFRLPGLAQQFGKSSYHPNLILRPGDVISITIFDLSSMSLLGPNPQIASGGSSVPPISGQSAQIPAQTIELDGSVTIPFGGHVKVAGLTPLQAGRQVEHALEGKSGNAQAVVSLVNMGANTATVGGDVGRPGAVQLTVRGERVLDVIANAGGTRFEPYDSDVLLVRNGHSAKVNLQRIIEDTQENVLIQPGDSLFISHNPRTFSVLGSAAKVSQYDFNTEQVSLAEAIARFGGPNDSLADLGDIYLLRYEPRGVIDRLIPPGDKRTASLPDMSRLPVAFHLDLRRGAGYFLAQAVPMRDKDVILVTNADAVELQKFLAIVRGFTGIVSDMKRTQP